MSHHNSTTRPIYGVYRGCSAGTALCSALDVMFEDGEVSESAAIAILIEFDKSINTHLVRNVNVECRLSNGLISTYRYRDQVWQLIIRQVRVQYNDHCWQQIATATPTRAKQLLVAKQSQVKQRMDDLTELSVGMTKKELESGFHEFSRLQQELQLLNTIAAAAHADELASRSSPSAVTLSLLQESGGKELLIPDIYVTDENDRVIEVKGRKRVQSVKIIASELWPKAKRW